MIGRMSDRTKQRVTVSLSADAAAALAQRAGANTSAYIERLVLADALAASLDSHREWFARRGGQAALEADERERLA